MLEIDEVEILEQSLAEKNEEIERLKAQLEELQKFNLIFVDILHHDLLNIVANIITYNEFLMEDETNENKLNDMNVIKSNVTKLENVIEDTYSYSRLKDYELQVKTVDINELIFKAVNFYNPLAREKGQSIEYDDVGQSLAKVDPILSDVISNLISNAIKFSPERTIVKLQLEDVGENWQILVKDQGEGVADEYKDKIFSRFTRIKKEGIRGNGLGLSIADRIIEMHKGKLWVEDNRPRGSIFVARFPKEI